MSAVTTEEVARQLGELSTEEQLVCDDLIDDYVGLLEGWLGRRFEVVDETEAINVDSCSGAIHPRYTPIGSVAEVRVSSDMDSEGVVVDFNVIDDEYIEIGPITAPATVTVAYAGGLDLDLEDNAPLKKIVKGAVIRAMQVRRANAQGVKTQAIGGYRVDFTAGGEDGFTAQELDRASPWRRLVRGPVVS